LLKNNSAARHSSQNLVIMVHLNKVERVNPQDVAAPRKFYAQAIASGKTDLDRLAYLISNQSTVRKADCKAVLEAFVHNMEDEMRQGRIVELGDLGNFQIGVSSRGEDTAEDVSENSVRSAHYNFRPGRTLRNSLRTLRYKLVG